MSYYNETIENELKIAEAPQHKIDGGQINETPGILFDYEKEYALAHFISADFVFVDTHLKRLFQARYSTRDELRQRFAHWIWTGKGECLATNNNNILNLVIKNKYYDTYDLIHVKEALSRMREICEERNIYKIAMPHLEGNWQNIKDIIMDIFMGTSFDIRIVYLDEYYKGNIINPDIEKINFGKDRKSIDGNTSCKYY